MRGSRNQRGVPTNIQGAIAQLSRGDAAEGRRMRIVVKKEDLKQVLEVIRDGRRRGPAAATSLEQRLNLMRRRQILRAASQVRGTNRLGWWRPVLQTIPE